MIDRTEEVRVWWLNGAHHDIEMVVPKSIEYGSNSLTQLGHKIAQLQGRTVDDTEARELGLWINEVQKVERWTDAVMRGDRPSDDTLTDIKVYATMAQRNRETGDWP